MIKVASSVEVSYSSQIDLNSLISLETSLYVGEKNYKNIQTQPSKVFFRWHNSIKKKKSRFFFCIILYTFIPNPNWNSKVVLVGHVGISIEVRCTFILTVNLKRLKKIISNRSTSGLTCRRRVKC